MNAKSRAQRLFEHILAAAKFARLFSLGDHRAVAGGRVKRRNSGAAGAHSFRQRALRIQLEFDFRR